MELISNSNLHSCEDVSKLRLELEERGGLGIENLVFKGGGAKGMAYIGAIKVRYKRPRNSVSTMKSTVSNGY